MARVFWWAGGASKLERNTMQIQVDASDLHRLAARLADQSPLWAQISALADGKLQQTHSSGQDPYGSGWAAKKDGGASFLRDRGNLEASRSFTSSASSATVGYGAFYAQFHQTGTSKMVARQLVPDSMPPDWQSPIDSLVEAWAASL